MRGASKQSVFYRKRDARVWLRAKQGALFSGQPVFAAFLRELTRPRVPPTPRSVASSKSMFMFF